MSAAAPDPVPATTAPATLASAGDAGPGAPRRTPPHTGIGRLSWVLLALAVALVLTVAGLNLVHVNKVVYVPGPVFNTLGSIDQHPVVTAKTKTYPTGGKLLFTTIRLEGGPSGKLTAWQWLRARMDPETTVVPYDEVYAPNQTQQQVKDQNTQLMQHSQEDAATVALRAAGQKVPEQILVAQIIKDAPADGVLEVNDRLLTVQGTPVTDSASVRKEIQALAPGSTVRMTVERQGEKKDLTLSTRKDPQSGRTIVGVYLAPKYQLPYPVTINAGAVGGPSAGLMFSLAVYDVITPGELTGGRTIAGTGTISGDGSVGPIGGIKQKMIAASHAGSRVFLAPKDNCTDVTGNVPAGMTVVAVSSFGEAEKAVEKIAGTDDPASLGLPSCPAG